MNKATTVFKVYFDGGFGRHMYGSWEVEYNGLSKKVSRINFEPRNGHKTNNVAEYLALEAALKWLQSVKDKGQYFVEIFTDSQLVERQVNGRYRCHKAHLQSHRDIILHLLKDFKNWTITWKRRDANVLRFGH